MKFIALVLSLFLTIYEEILNDQYLVLLPLFLMAALGFAIIDDILGTINGSIKEGFDWKVFLIGKLKRLGICLVLLLFAFVVDFFIVSLNHVPNVNIGTETITVLEIIALAIVWCIDSSIDIFNKCKELIKLKYKNYDDVKIDTNEYGVQDDKDRG